MEPESRKRAIKSRTKEEQTESASYRRRFGPEPLAVAFNRSHHGCLDGVTEL
jgi:hypothetical protein